MAKQNPEDLTDTRPLLVKKSDVSDQDKWKLALAHLKSNDLDLARKLLTELADHPNSYKNKATKALQKINK